LLRSVGACAGGRARVLLAADTGRKVPTRYGWCCFVAAGGLGAVELQRWGLAPVSLFVT